MTIDIDKMFKEAAGAAEDTGEENPAKFSKDGKKKVETQEVKAEQPQVEQTEKSEKSKQAVAQEQPKPAPKPQAKPQPQPAPQPQPQPQPRPQPKPAPQRAPQRATQPKSEFIQTDVELNVNTIARVLKMNSMLAKLEESERKFIVEYFVEDSDNALPKTINNAFTVDKRDIAALDKIVVSRGHSPADRAFYLMGLPNEVIQTIFSQVDKLNKGSQESKIPQVNDSNKIEACRTLEKAISSMDEKLIKHIEKVIQFAYIADLDK